MSDPIFFPQRWGCFAFCAHIPLDDRYLQAVFGFQLLAVKISWPCMYIEWQNKTPCFCVASDKPWLITIENFVEKTCFPTNLSTNVDIELWQTPIHFLVAALVLHGTSVVDNGNRLCKDTTWLGCIGIPVIFGLPFHGITTPNRQTGIYNSQSMVGISN